jgi:hypothetical protein
MPSNFFKKELKILSSKRGADLENFQKWVPPVRSTGGRRGAGYLPPIQRAGGASSRISFLIREESPPAAAKASGRDGPFSYFFV